MFYVYFVFFFYLFFVFNDIFLIKLTFDSYFMYKKCRCVMNKWVILYRYIGVHCYAGIRFHII